MSERNRRMRDKIKEIEGDLKVLHMLVHYTKDEATIDEIEDHGWNFENDVIPIAHKYDLIRHTITEERLFRWKPKVKNIIEDLEKKRDVLEEKLRRNSFWYNPWVLKIGSGSIIALISFLLGYLTKALGGC